MMSDTDTYPVKLTENSWVLGNSLFNLYFIQGKTASILIEAGVSAVVDIAAEQMEKLNISPDYIVVTHPHSDHLTGLEGLCGIYPHAVPVAGPGAVEFFTHPKAVQSMIWEDRHMTDRLSEWGWKIKRPPVNTPPEQTGIKIMADKSEFDLGGITAQFIETFGHSPGSLAVFIPEIKLLASSDALGFRYSDGGFLPVFFTGFKEYLDSLERLKSFHPEILCPGHQGPLTGHVVVDKAFSSARTAALELKQRIQNYSGLIDELADELFKESYRDEFKVYSRENILNCIGILINRSRCQSMPHMN